MKERYQGAEFGFDGIKLCGGIRGLAPGQTCQDIFGLHHEGGQARMLCKIRAVMNIAPQTGSQEVIHLGFGQGRAARHGKACSRLDPAGHAAPVGEDIVIADKDPGTAAGVMFGVELMPQPDQPRERGGHAVASGEGVSHFERMTGSKQRKGSDAFGGQHRAPERPEAAETGILEHEERRVAEFGDQHLARLGMKGGGTGAVVPALRNAGPVIPA